MKKPGTLRQALTAELPYLRANPDKLALFVTAGSVKASMAGTSISYQLAYTLEVVVFDYAHPSETLIAPILAWLNTHQVEMLQNPDLMDKGFSFEAEILDHDKADFIIKLALTERVLLSVQGNVRKAVYADEPALAE